MSAVASDPFLRAPRDLALTPDDRIAGVIDRRLRSIRQRVIENRRDRALSIATELLGRAGRRLPADQDLIDGLWGIVFAVEYDTDREVRREISALRWSIRDAVKAARRWRPPPRTRWVPPERRERTPPKELSPEEKAEQQRRWEVFLARREAHQAAIEEQRAAVPWGQPLPKALWFWNSPPRRS